MSFEFTLILNRAPTEDEIEALYEAGCDDGAPVFNPATDEATIAFDRDAGSLAAAIVSAVRDVEKVPGLYAVGVEQDDLVTLRDVASRIGRTYESVRLLAAGKRGPGGFPAPVREHRESRWSFYSWQQVAPWLHDALHLDVAVPAFELGLADEMLRARRDLLAADERTRAELRPLLAS